MNDNDFIDQFEVEKEPVRSRFLSSICIFTWIGCWFVVLYYGMRIVKINDIERSIYHFEEWETEFHLMKVGVVAPVFSAIGAYFIWRLKRIGFFIYALGQVMLGVFGLYVYAFVRQVEAPQTFYFMAFFACQLAYIILYAINWKKLR